MTQFSFLSFCFVSSAVERRLECALVHPELDWVDCKASDVCGVRSWREKFVGTPFPFYTNNGHFRLTKSQLF